MVKRPTLEGGSVDGWLEGGRLVGPLSGRRSMTKRSKRETPAQGKSRSVEKTEGRCVSKADHHFGLGRLAAEKRAGSTSRGGGGKKTKDEKTITQA